MSNRREQFEGESDLGDVTEWLGRSYHYITVGLLLIFTFWNRARNWNNFLVDGKVLFRGNDPWYHYRSVQYTVNNYPQTMPFEVWTQFPIGTAPAQFGTFYDQLVAMMALVVGLGSPSEQLVRKVVLVAPAFFGMLVIIPAYFIGRRLGGRFGGVMAAATIALAPDALLSRSVAGFSDHHVAEALFQGLAVLAVMVALSAAQKEKPVYELILDREWDALRRPLGWSVLAGVAISMYLWTWPPGVLLVGILGVFFLIQLSAEVVRGNSPEHTAFVGVVALATAALLQLPSLATLELSATSRSILQPGLALAIAAGCVFMAWLFRQWEAQDLDKYLYPITIVAILLVGAGLMRLLLPGTFNFFVDQVLRVVGFQTSPAAGTIGEAQPLRNPQTLLGYYRLTLAMAVGGVIIILTRQIADDRPPVEGLLVVIWFVFMIAATFTQARFAYYLAVPVAALTAVSVGAVMQLVGDIEEEVEPYQVMAVLSVLLVVVAPMFIASGSALHTPLAMEQADRGSQPGGVTGWQESLDWMENNTPEEGKYANPDGEKIEYYGTFGRADDYDYPEGSYGVMSWWDYGHWITVEGERIPNANPFQQGATTAARYLTAQNESGANQILDELDEDDAQTRYVMVDWKMAETETQIGGKYFAPLRFNPNTNRSEFYTRVLDTEQLRQRGVFGSTQLIRKKQPYFNSTMVRLYHYHGSAQRQAPVVLNWQGAEEPLGNGDTFVRPPANEQMIQTFRSMRGARQFVENDSTSQIGGFGTFPQERVPALKHYRLVHMDERSAASSRRFSNVALRAFQNVPSLRRIASAGAGQNASRQQQVSAVQNILYRNTPSWVKTFERVPGATIDGSNGPQNQSLTLTVEMNPENGRNFTYRQRVPTDENGNFETTVPYASTGGDAIGVEEGYTNTSVRATGPYQIETPGRLINFTSGEQESYSATFDVSEAQVVGANESSVPVELNKTVFDQPQGDTNTTDDTNTSNDTNTSDDTTTGDGSDSTETTDDTNTSDGTTETPSSGGEGAPEPTESVLTASRAD